MNSSGKTRLVRVFYFEMDVWLAGGYAAFWRVMRRFEEICGVLQEYAAICARMRRFEEICRDRRANAAF